MKLKLKLKLERWKSSCRPTLTGAWRVSGWRGKTCQEEARTPCPSACHGRGVCKLGFCHCFPGSYGERPESTPSPARR
eukprot:1179462-Prorocentrum_minimum.AAC.1